MAVAISGIGELLKRQLSALTIHVVTLAQRVFASADAATAFVTGELGLKATGCKVKGDTFVVEVHPAGVFVEGSLRILRDVADGVSVTVGLPFVSKALAAGVPRAVFNFEELSFLEGLTIHEVTLTRAPALGTSAHFVMSKSLKGKSPDRIAPQFTKNCSILKIDAKKRQVFGYALVPDLPDLEGDITTAAEVESCSISFMRQLSQGTHSGDGIGEEHQVFTNIGFPIVNMFDEQGLFGVKGGWWFGVQVTNDEVWAAVERGEIKGFSIGGTGKRRKASDGEIGFRSKGVAPVVVALLVGKATAKTRDDAAKIAEARGLSAGTIIDRGDAWELVQIDRATVDASTLHEIAEGDIKTVRAASLSASTNGEGGGKGKALEDLDLLGQLVPKVCDGVFELFAGWVVAMFVNRVVFETPTGQLLAVGFTVDGKNEIAFSDPVAVERQFVEVEMKLSRPIFQQTKSGPEAKGAVSWVSWALGALFGKRKKKGATEMDEKQVRGIVADEIGKQLAPLVKQLEKLGVGGQSTTDDESQEGNDGSQNSQTMDMSAVIALANGRTKSKKKPAKKSKTKTNKTVDADEIDSDEIEDDEIDAGEIDAGDESETTDDHEDSSEHDERDEHEDSGDDESDDEDESDEDESDPEDDEDDEDGGSPNFGANDGGKALAHVLGKMQRSQSEQGKLLAKLTDRVIEQGNRIDTLSGKARTAKSKPAPSNGDGGGGLSVHPLYGLGCRRNRRSR